MDVEDTPLEPRGLCELPYLAERPGVHAQRRETLLVRLLRACVLRPQCDRKPQFDLARELLLARLAIDPGRKVLR